jgi:hypothetical protein
VLLLPEPAIWDGLSAVGLKPVRAWTALHTGFRIQASAGVRLWIWGRTAVLVSCATAPVAGFLHGPASGQRSSIALAPGQVAIIHRG